MTPTEQPRYIVFGYGSLIFKPPPHTIERTPGFLKGCVRRFAHSSTDHRGTPEAPGRVVTLVHIEDWQRFSGSDPFPEEDVVWGVAYTIDPEYAVEVKAYLGDVYIVLDVISTLTTTLRPSREGAYEGYTEENIDVWGFVDGGPVVVVPAATVYVGRPDNPSFIGSESIEALAQTIWVSEGPSGRNKDYLYQLSAAVKELAPESHDSHLHALETRVRELDGISQITDVQPN